MQVSPLPLPGLVLVEPTVFGDARGFFLESYNKTRFEAAVGHAIDFVQDNHSRSLRGVLRGLHYQLPPNAQGKLIRVVAGEIFDVAVDIRRASPTFGQWAGVKLSAENKKQLWVPIGFAHGFVVTSDAAEVIYKASNYYAPAQERSILWDDPAIGVSWPLDAPPVLSAKDVVGCRLADAEVFD